MKKNWMVTIGAVKSYDSLEVATAAGKKLADRAFKQDYDTVSIYELVSAAEAPVPAIDFVAVTV